MLHSTIKDKLPLVTQLFKENKIKNAYAFGSVVGDNFNEQSDIDLLINSEEGLEPLEKGERWWSLHDALRDVFKREIALLI